MLSVEIIEKQEKQEKQPPPPQILDFLFIEMHYLEDSVKMFIFFTVKYFMFSDLDIFGLLFGFQLVKVYMVI